MPPEKTLYNICNALDGLGLISYSGRLGATKHAIVREHALGTTLSQLGLIRYTASLGGNWRDRVDEIELALQGLGLITYTRARSS